MHSILSPYGSPSLIWCPPPPHTYTPMDPALGMSRNMAPSMTLLLERRSTLSLMERL